MRTMTRGLFLTTLALAGCVGEFARLVEDGRVKTRIGVMAHTEVGWITETKTLERALRFYRQENVDAVAIVGKVTRDGNRNQREVLDQVWRKVFAGTATRLIVTEGRHEVGGFAFATASRRPLGTCEVPTFYAGSKVALTDELCNYPGEAKAICAGSMSGVDVPEMYADAKRLSRAVAQVAQGLLVDVRDGATIVRRLDFTAKEPPDRRQAAELRKAGRVYAEEVAEPWKVGAKQAKEPAPEFWDDTRVQVLIGQDKGETIYTVKWPNVQKRFTGARARFYVVEAACPETPDRPVLRKSVLSDGFYGAETRDVAGVKCVVKASELPGRGETRGAVFFSVTPVGSFGKSGKTFRTEAVPLP